MTERTAESIATNLEAWANYIDQWAGLIRYAPGLPKLAHECAPQLRDAAAWVREQQAADPAPAADPVPTPAQDCGMGMDPSRRRDPTPTAGAE